MSWGQAGFALLRRPQGSHPEGCPGEAGNGTPAWGMMAPLGLQVRAGDLPALGGAPLGHSHGEVRGAWEGAYLCSSHMYF